MKNTAKNKFVVFTFGRFQGFTKAHAGLFKYILKYSKKIGADHRIYVSQTEDNEDNPLSYVTKLYLLRKIFPKMNFVCDTTIKTPFDALYNLQDCLYENVYMVAGPDRAGEYYDRISKYWVGSQTFKSSTPLNNILFFNHFDVMQFNYGNRSNISGTKLREAVKNRDWSEFWKHSYSSHLDSSEQFEAIWEKYQMSKKINTIKGQK